MKLRTPVPSFKTVETAEPHFVVPISRITHSATKQDLLSGAAKPPLPRLPLPDNFKRHNTVSKLKQILNGGVNRNEEYHRFVRKHSIQASDSDLVRCFNKRRLLF